MLFSFKLCAQLLSLSALLVVIVKATLYKQESAEARIARSYFIVIYKLTF
jgi:hypothetical protein